MWSPDQQPCTVTIALLPRPGTVTLWEAGGTAQSRGACLLMEHHHLQSSNPEGGLEHPLTWPGVKPSSGVSSRQRISASGRGCLRPGA